MMRELLAALLRGDRPAQPDRSLWPGLLELAEAQGVAPLIAAAASRAGWSPSFVRAVRPRCAAEAALSAVRARELRAVLGALQDAGARPLIVKGAQLEWTHYPAPGTRPRTDTDLLISEEDRDCVRRALECLRYQPLAHVTGEVAFTQFHYWRVDGSGARHALDVHWRVVNPKVLSDRLPFEELFGRRVAIPALGPHAYAPAATDAMQIACLHRSAHHRNSDLLIWVYDIHLLAMSFQTSDWNELADAAVRRGIGDFVLAGLMAADRSFRTPVPNGVIARLSEGRRGSAPRALQFGPGRAELHVLLSDWRHTSGCRNRLRFLREHLLPPPAYMAHRYRTSNRAVLPLLYVYRIARGARRFF